MKRMHGGASTKERSGSMHVAGDFAVRVCFAKADVVLDWNEIAVNTAIANGQNPFAQARYAAIVQLAVFEAVNAITGDYRPYLGTIIAAPRCLRRSGSHQAAYQVLSTYFPGSATDTGCSARCIAGVDTGRPSQD